VSLPFLQKAAFDPDALEELIRANELTDGNTIKKLKASYLLEDTAGMAEGLRAVVNQQLAIASPHIRRGFFAATPARVAPQPSSAAPQPASDYTPGF
jgi:hypothetical protein